MSMRASTWWACRMGSRPKPPSSLRATSPRGGRFTVPRSSPHTRLPRKGGDPDPYTLKLIDPLDPRFRGELGGGRVDEDPLPRLCRYFPHRGKIISAKSSPPGGSGPKGRRGSCFLKPPTQPNPPQVQSIVTTTLPMALRLAKWVMALPESARLKVSETWGRILPST